MSKVTKMAKVNATLLAYQVYADEKKITVKKSFTKSTVTGKLCCDLPPINSHVNLPDGNLSSGLFTREISKTPKLTKTYRFR